MVPNRLRVRFATLALAVMLVATTGGCGLLIVKGPPVGHEQMDYFTCTEGDAGPILDLVWGGLNIAGALVCASDPDAYENSSACIIGGFGWGPGQFSSPTGLSALEGLTPAYTINGPGGDVTWNRSADGYRLPTEAEWEFAWRAGSDSKGF